MEWGPALKGEEPKEMRGWRKAERWKWRRSEKQRRKDSWRRMEEQRGSGSNEDEWRKEARETGGQLKATRDPGVEEKKGGKQN